jgi:hypothetical protein
MLLADGGRQRWESQWERDNGLYTFLLILWLDAGTRNCLQLALALAVQKICNDSKTARDCICIPYAIWNVMNKKWIDVVSVSAYVMYSISIFNVKHHELSFKNVFFISNLYKLYHFFPVLKYFLLSQVRSTAERFRSNSWGS